MPQYVIERTIPNAGNLSASELQEISRHSTDVLDELGPDIQWRHSYVTDDKVYCVYEAASEDLIRQHGQKGGFPVDSVSEVKAVINPATAGGRSEA